MRSSSEPEPAQDHTPAQRPLSPGTAKSVPELSIWIPSIPKASTKARSRCHSQTHTGPADPCWTSPRLEHTS